MNTIVEYEDKKKRSDQDMSKNKRKTDLGLGISPQLDIYKVYVYQVTLPASKQVCRREGRREGQVGAPVVARVRRQGDP